MRPIYDAQFRGEIRKRMSPPSRETATEISRATGISRQTLYSWRHLWKREGELVPASSSSAEEWDSSDKLAAVIQAAGLSGTDLGSYCRERGLYPQQLARWRQAAVTSAIGERAVGTLCKWIRCTEHGGSKGIAA
jgi:transposase-like protein